MRTPSRLRSRRKWPKDAEKWWKCLKSKQTGYAFARQKPILNYIADFYCKELDLVVEIDGASHFSTEAYLRDKERDRQMTAIGLEVLRVIDSDVRRDPNRVADYIKEHCDLVRGRMREAEAGK